MKECGPTWKGTGAPVVLRTSRSVKTTSVVRDVLSSTDQWDSGFLTGQKLSPGLLLFSAPDLVDEDVGGDDNGTETDFVPTLPEELAVAETTRPPTEPDTTLVQTEPMEEEHTPTPGAIATRVQPQDVLSSEPEEEEEREESVIRKEEVLENLEISAPVGSGSGSGSGLSVLFLCLTAVLTLGL